MKYTTILLFTGILLSFQVYGQNEPRVVTFKSDENNIENNHLEQNILKLSLFEYFSGDFALYYERALGDMFGLEMSLGATLYDIIGNIVLFDEIGTEDKELKYGLSYSFALRFYPVDLFEEFYVSAEYKFRKYNWNQNYYDFGIHEETLKYSIPRLNFGYTSFYDNNLLFDYFLGIGVNTITSERYDYDSDSVTTEQLNPRPKFHIGLKVGYAF